MNLTIDLDFSDDEDFSPVMTIPLSSISSNAYRTEYRLPEYTYPKCMDLLNDASIKRILYRAGIASTQPDVLKRVRYQLHDTLQDILHRVGAIKEFRNVKVLQAHHIEEWLDISGKYVYKN